MKWIHVFYLLFLCIAFFSCSSVAIVDEIKKEDIIEETKKNPDMTLPELEKKVIEILEVPDPQPIVSLVPEKTDTQAVPVTAGKTVDSSGYKKAIGSLVDSTVTEDQYLADKQEILSCIDELGKIIAERNFDLWLKYLTTDSIRYWSDSKNLNSAALRLPIKGLKINNLRDYFTYVFIPARQGRSIGEIRYISPELVKAVQTIGENDIIFYHFLKVENEWKIHLDRLDN